MSENNSNLDIIELAKMLDTEDMIGFTRKFVDDFEKGIQSISIERFPWIEDISNQKWKKIPYTRKQLNLLSKLDLKMNKKEFLKRIRCTYFEGKPSPFLIINGERFDYVKKK